MFKRIIIFLLAVGAMPVLLAFPQQTASAVKGGCKICFDTLLPSLFPFMIIASFLSLSGALWFFSAPFFPLMKTLSLPKQAFGIWLSSFIGGYPSGAHTICSLVRCEALSKREAQRLLPCCINSGPAFLVLAVGNCMLNSMKIGYLLLVSQAISSALICLLFARESNAFSDHKKPGFLPPEAALVTAVSSSATAMLGIFAFVITFSVITSMVKAVSPKLYPLTALLEVTLGCDFAKAMPHGVLIIAFLLGFGGFSVCFQIMALAQGEDIKPLGFWKIRFMAGALNALIMRAFIWLFPIEAAVFFMSQQSSPLAVWSTDRLLGGICFCAMLLISMQKLDNKQHIS